MVGGQKGQGMNWKAGDKDRRLIVIVYFNLWLESWSKGFRSGLCWVWAGCVLGQKLGLCCMEGGGCRVYSTLDWVCLAWQWAVRESETGVLGWGLCPITEKAPTSPLHPAHTQTASHATLSLIRTCWGHTHSQTGCWKRPHSGRHSCGPILQATPKKRGPLHYS